MTSGFYEQLGVSPDASAGQLRAAYGRAVARWVRRRKAILEQGGDTTPLDHARQQLDEAWAVLSDPVRRRRYDALLHWTQGQHPRTPDALWEEVGDALVHPAAAVAAKLLRVTTSLQQIGHMPLAPSSSEDEPPTLVPHDDDLTAPRIAPRRLGPPPGDRSPVVSRPPRPAVPQLGEPREPSLEVVDVSSPLPAGSPSGHARFPASDPAVYVLPEAAQPRQPSPEPPPSRVEPRDLTPEELTRLVNERGYSGALLKAVREQRGFTLQEVADDTRISVRYLEAIEADRFADLPSPTFVRGYVREMARMLGLDADAVVAGYMRRVSG